MESASSYKRQMDYYQNQMDNLNDLITNTNKLLEEEQEKYKTLDALAEQAKVIKDDMGQIHPDLKAISGYLEKVIINQAPYDHGEFGGFSSEMEAYAGEYNELYNEIVKMRDWVQQTIDSHNQLLQTYNEKLRTYNSDYTTAQRNYRKALLAEANGVSTTETSNENPSVSNANNLSGGWKKQEKMVSQLLE